MADENKKIILQVGMDTSEAAAGVDNLNEKLDGLNDKSIDAPFKNMKQQLKEANNEAQKMQQQFGANSKQFADAAKKVANLKDEFADYAKTVEAFNPDNKLQALISLGRGAVGAIQGITGAMSLLGIESEDANKTIAKLQALMAFSDALNSVDDIKNSFKNFKTVIGESTVVTKANAAATTLATTITKLFGGAVDTTSNSFKVLRGAIVALGIGALIVAIGYVVANFDKLKDAISFTSKEQKFLKETTDDYKKAATSAATKVNEVKAAFDLARQGVISKKEALKKYNDTLGDSLGKTNNLITAEKNLTDKAEAYIKITGLKAQANALFAKSAEESSKALLASQEDQTSFLDKTKTFLANAYIGGGAGTGIAIEAQNKGVAEAKKTYAENSKILQEEGEKLLKQAGDLSKEFKVAANLVDNKDDEKKKTDNSAYLAAKALNQKIKDEIELQNKIAREKELIEEERTHKANIKILKAGGLETETEIDAHHKRRFAIIDKYDKEAIAKFNELIEANKEKQQKAYEEELKQLEDQKKAKEELGKTQADDYSENTQNLVDNPNLDFDQKRAALDADAEFLNSSLALVQYGEEERTRLVKENSDARKEIDEKEKEAKLANLDFISSAAEAASDLLGKNTVAGKALAIASTTISTYEGAQKAYASQMSVPDPSAPIRAAVAAGLAIVQGLARVKAILSVKVPTKAANSGGSPAAPSISTAPVINASQTNLANQAVQDVRLTNPSSIVAKAYITQDELRNNEERNAFLNSRSTI